MRGAYLEAIIASALFTTMVWITAIGYLGGEDGCEIWSERRVWTLGGDEG